MHLRGDFLMPSERPQPPAANDNCVGDESFTVRNLVSAQLTYKLAVFARDDGAP